MHESLKQMNATNIKAEDDALLARHGGIADTWLPFLPRENKERHLWDYFPPVKIDHMVSASSYVVDPSSIYLYGCDIKSTSCITKPINVNTFVFASGFPENIQLLIQGRSTAQPAVFFGAVDPSLQFFKAEIENIIIEYEQLPVSYNQVMVRGALRYCAKLFDRTYDVADDLIDNVKRFVVLTSNLRKQIEAFATFSHLDLTYVENIFESIEEEASIQGIMPKLEDMPL